MSRYAEHLRGNVSDVPLFVCPWCGADDEEDVTFYSIQRTTVEYQIRTTAPDDFNYTGESEVFDEGCEHEYYRCRDCKHFFINAAGNGLNVQVKSRESEEFALLLVAAGELCEVPPPDGWDTVGVRDGQQVRDARDEFWESTYLSERECWKALRKKGGT